MVKLHKKTKGLMIRFKYQIYNFNFINYNLQIIKNKKRKLKKRIDWGV